MFDPNFRKAQFLHVLIVFESHLVRTLGGSASTHRQGHEALAVDCSSVVISLRGNL